MGLQMASLGVSYWEIELYYYIVLSLVPMKVLNQDSGMGKYLAQKLELLTDSHLVRIMEQSQDGQKAPLMGLQMVSLRVYCWELDLDEQMGLSIPLVVPWLVQGQQRIHCPQEIGSCQLQGEILVWGLVPTPKECRTRIVLDLGVFIIHTTGLFSASFIYVRSDESWSRKA